MHRDIIFIILALSLLSGCVKGRKASDMAADAYFKKDYAQAFKLASAYASGDMRAKRLLATLYFEGKGTEQNSQKAIAILTPLADAGDSKSQTLLAAVFIAPGPWKNAEKAIAYNKKAIAQNNHEASFNLGLIYLNGLAGKKDTKLAYHYLSQANAQGSAKASLFLGSLSSDPSESCPLFALAAKRGSSQGALWYGRCLVQGSAGRKDFAAAAHWYRIAAQQGEALAQANLGYLAENGLGSAIDLAAAKKWYCLAKDDIPSAAIRLKALHLSCEAQQ